MKCVLQAQDGTYYKSDVTRTGATLEDVHIFQDEKAASIVQIRLNNFYAETVYTIVPVIIVIK